MDSRRSSGTMRKLSLENPRRRVSPHPGASPVIHRISRGRKTSFPSGQAWTTVQGHTQAQDSNRGYRRFSNVSDVVSRKLSTTIGWRTISIQEVVTQSKSMCGQHIRTCLKRRNLFNKRLGLQRLRSVANLPGNTAVCDVFVQLEALAMEMEKRHPKLYSGVCRQMGLVVASEKSVAKALSAMALELFKVDISWFKIASFYNIVSGTAVDCVQAGHPEYLYGLVEAMGLVIERDVANWIANQGGWVAILSKFREPEDTGFFQMIAFSVTGLIVFLMSMAIILRSLGNLVIYYQS